RVSAMRRQLALAGCDGHGVGEGLIALAKDGLVVRPLPAKGRDREGQVAKLRAQRRELFVIRRRLKGKEVQVLYRATATHEPDDALHETQPPERSWSRKQSFDQLGRHRPDGGGASAVDLDLRSSTLASSRAACARAVWLRGQHRVVGDARRRAPG